MSMTTTFQNKSRESIRPSFKNAFCCSGSLYPQLSTDQFNKGHVLGGSGRTKCLGVRTLRALSSPSIAVSHRLERRPRLSTEWLGHGNKLTAILLNVCHFCTRVLSRTHTCGFAQANVAEASGPCAPRSKPCMGGFQIPGISW